MTYHLERARQTPGDAVVARQQSTMCICQLPKHGHVSLCMETRTVKPLPNTSRRVMPRPGPQCFFLPSATLVEKRILAEEPSKARSDKMALVRETRYSFCLLVAINIVHRITIGANILMSVLYESERKREGKR